VGVPLTHLSQRYPELDISEDEGLELDMKFWDLDLLFVEQCLWEI
jgi:hypothetical protein